MYLREKVTKDTFMGRLFSAKTQSEAKAVFDSVFSMDASTVTSSFKSPVECSWEIFYPMVEKENEFKLDHKASAYYVMNLLEPKLKVMWNKKDILPIKKWSEYGDFLTDVWGQIYTKLTPKLNKKGKIEGWDKSTNDNFLAYILPEIRTILNEVTETEVSKYIADTYDISVGSLDALIDNSENPLQVHDRTINVEEHVVNKIMLEENASYKQLKASAHKSTKEQISDVLTASFMADGMSDKELDKYISEHGDD